MPWLPELFTAPALARVWEDERRRQLALVPFFAGVMTGETLRVDGGQAAGR